MVVWRLDYADSRVNGERYTAADTNQRSINGIDVYHTHKLETINCQLRPNSKELILIRDDTPICSCNQHYH